MGEKHAVDRPVRRDADIIDQDIDRPPKVLETRYQGYVQRTLGQLLAKLGRMIEYDLARPVVNQGACVEVLDAADPDSFGRRHA